MESQWQIPDLQLIEKIGKGGFGEVWIAKDLLGEFKAVKIITAGDESIGNLSDKEWKGLENYQKISLQHPELLTVHHIGKGDGFVYYLMELADPLNEDWQSLKTPYSPKTLTHWLTNRGRLPRDECINLAQQTLSGLNLFHKNSLIHRDVKPSNIIFVNGQAKLADIGMVRSLGQQISFAGTESYLPPEGPRTPASDIFSLGKVFYQMLTGLDVDKFPTLPIENLDQKNKAWTLEFNAIISKCTDPNPRNRYQSASEALKDIELLQNGKSVRTRNRARKLARIAASFLLATLLLSLLWLGINALVKDQGAEELITQLVYSTDFTQSEALSDFWTRNLPFPSSEVIHTNGSLLLKSRGQLISQKPLSNNLKISGKLKFSDSRSVLTMALRSSGSFSDSRYAELDGIRIQLRAEGRVTVEPGDSIPFKFPINKSIDFSIVDFRDTISVYLQGDEEPAIQVNVPFRSGNRLAMYNREFPDLTTAFDSLTVADIINDQSLSSQPPSMQEITEDFDSPTLNPSIWEQHSPWKDSKVLVNQGKLQLHNQGTLISKIEIPSQATIDGRFRFIGNPEDTFRILFRLNDIEDLEHRRLGAEFRITDTEKPNGSANLSLTGSSEIQAHGSYPIGVNEWIEFKILDQGQFVSLFVADSDTPQIIVKTEIRFGKKMGFQNREGAAAGSHISAGSVVEIDYLKISDSTNQAGK